MPSNNSSDVLVINIPAWLNSLTKRRNNSSFIFRPDGDCKYYIQGQEIDAKEFDTVFPVSQLYQNINKFGERKDGRQI